MSDPCERQVVCHKVAWNAFQHARAEKRKHGFFLTALVKTFCGQDGLWFAGTWHAVTCRRCLAARKRKEGK